MISLDKTFLFCIHNRTFAQRDFLTVIWWGSLIWKNQMKMKEKYIKVWPQAENRYQSSYIKNQIFISPNHFEIQNLHILKQCDHIGSFWSHKSQYLYKLKMLTGQSALQCTFVNSTFIAGYKIRHIQKLIEQESSI